LAARNTIGHLAQYIEQGIVTTLTHAYLDAVSRRTGAADLTDAEAVALNSMG